MRANPRHSLEHNLRHNAKHRPDIRGYLGGQATTAFGNPSWRPGLCERGAAPKFVLIDGFIEAVDLSHLSSPVRGAGYARLLSLVGRRHVTQGVIKRALLLAGDLAGARLRSAITPGTATGGGRLVVKGDFVRIEGQIGADNSLPTSLGTLAGTKEI